METIVVVGFCKDNDCLENRLVISVFILENTTAVGRLEIEDDCLVTKEIDTGVIDIVLPVGVFVNVIVPEFDIAEV